MILTITQQALVRRVAFSYNHIVELGRTAYVDEMVASYIDFCYGTFKPLSQDGIDKYREELEMVLDLVFGKDFN